MNKFYITLLMSLAVLFVHGQKDEQLKGDTLIIIKDFEPTLVKANKIFEEPAIKDTQKVELDFNYSFLPKQLPSHYEVDSIEAAKIKGEPLLKLYRGYVRLGFGSNTTPLAEVFVNGLRSKKSSWGVHLKHFSSNGINSIDDSKFSNNRIDLYGKKFTKKHSFSGDIDYTIDNFNYYGDYFNSKVASPALDVFDVKSGNTYNKFGAHLAMENTTTDSADVNFSLGLRFRSMKDDYVTSENNFKLRTLIQGRIDDKLIGLLGIDVDNNSYKSESNDTLPIDNSTTILKIYPHVKAGNEVWSFVAGPAFFVEAGDESDFVLSVIGELKVNLIKEILIPYAGVKGELKRNHLHSFSEDNQFVSPVLDLKNSIYEPQLYAGLRGSFSSKISFNTSVSNGSIKSMPFYTRNYTELSYYRSLYVVYDDVNQTLLTGELSYQNKEKWKVFLMGEYFDYKTDTLLAAYHKPNYKITLTGMYDLRDKIILKIDLFGIGEQKALLSNQIAPTPIPAEGEVITLKGIMDVNLGLEYRYTKKVSAFLNFNNIASVKYERWHDYPTQRFNVLGGVKFSF